MSVIRSPDFDNFSSLAILVEAEVKFEGGAYTMFRHCDEWMDAELTGERYNDVEEVVLVDSRLLVKSAKTDLPRQNLLLVHVLSFQVSSPVSPLVNKMKTSVITLMKARPGSALEPRSPRLVGTDELPSVLKSNWIH